MQFSEEFMTGRVTARETAARVRETELLRVIRAEHEARNDEGQKIGWVQRYRAAAAARAASRRVLTEPASEPTSEPASEPATVPAGAQAPAQGAVSEQVAGAGDGAREAAAASASAERRELEPAAR
jgi:hypothetical protein